MTSLFGVYLQMFACSSEVHYQYCCQCQGPACLQSCAQIAIGASEYALEVVPIAKLLNDRSLQAEV